MDRLPKKVFAHSLFIHMICCLGAFANSEQSAMLGFLSGGERTYLARSKNMIMMVLLVVNSILWFNMVPMTELEK